MGLSHNRISWHRINCHVIIVFLFMVSVSTSLTHLTFMAQGRPVSESPRRELVGSRPPRCERRCDSCRRCEAVQVPVQNQRRNTRVVSVAYARGDDCSNYKPMGWKCKCGDLFFNP